MVAPILQPVSDAIRPYPPGWTRRLVARDGREVLIRPMRPDDEAAMIEFHRGLSEQSVHWRYFRTMPLATRIAHERLATICRPDLSNEAVLVAEWVPEEGVPVIVGVGRLEDLPGTGGKSAEFAVLVADAWQRQGVGRRLLAELAAMARVAGRRKLVADVLPDNTRMQRMCQQLGFAVRFDFEDRVMKVTMDLTEKPAE